MYEHGGMERVIRAIRYLRDRCSRGRADVERKLEFSRKNRLRMRYRSLKDRNLPIGSGVLDAVNKSAVTKGFEGSGMRWSKEGGQAITAFRAPILSGRFGCTWNALAADDNADPTRRAPAAWTENVAMLKLHAPSLTPWQSSPARDRARDCQSGSGRRQTGAPGWCRSGLRKRYPSTPHQRTRRQEQVCEPGRQSRLPCPAEEAKRLR